MRILLSEKAANLKQRQNPYRESCIKTTPPPSSTKILSETLRRVLRTIQYHRGPKAQVKQLDILIIIMPQTLGEMLGLTHTVQERIHTLMVQHKMRHKFLLKRMLTLLILPI